MNLSKEHGDLRHFSRTGDNIRTAVLNKMESYIALLKNWNETEIAFMHKLLALPKLIKNIEFHEKNGQCISPKIPLQYGDDVPSVVPSPIGKATITEPL